MKTNPIENVLFGGYSNVILMYCGDFCRIIGVGILLIIIWSTVGLKEGLIALLRKYRRRQMKNQSMLTLKDELGVFCYFAIYIVLAGLLVGVVAILLWNLYAAYMRYQCNLNGMDMPKLCVT